MLTNYFKILGLPENASIYEIKKAYRKKVKLYHPDVSSFENAHIEFVKINEAYRALLNFRLGKDKKKSAYISHEEWLKARREKARREATKHAKIKYEEFKKSNIYRTTKVVTNLLYYLYIILGILMIVSPILTISIKGVNPRSPSTSIAGMVIIVILGIIFVITLFSTRKSFEY